ncbi:hypothetical protein QUF75_08255 [Desulfococcaceae bacterium HSG7]|nr:hypothetical protein [Desulfococcaceae bacterium HSG7]
MKQENEKAAPANYLKTSLIDVLFIIFYKCYTVIGIFMVIFIIAVGHVFLVKPKYKVSSSILIKPLVDTRTQLDTFGRFSVERIKVEDLNTEVKVMNSKELMIRVAEKLKLIPSDNKNDPNGNEDRTAESVNQGVNLVRGGLAMLPVSMSSVIQISKTGTDPDKITEILTAYLETYIDWHIEVFKVGNSVNFYRNQASVYKNKLKEVEYDLEALRKKWGIIDIKEQNLYNIKLLQLLRDQLGKIRGETTLIQTKIYHLDEQKRQTGKLKPMISEFRDSSLLTQIIKGYAPLAAEKERIASLYPESSIEYKNVVQQLKRFQIEIEIEKKNLLNGLIIDFDALKKREMEFISYIEKTESESKLLNEQVIKINQMDREMKLYEKTYKLYKSKFEEALISEKRNKSKLSNVFILNWPKKPTAPFYPDKNKRVVIAILAGLIVSIGSAFARYYLDQTIKKPDDLTNLVGIPVLSSLGIIRPAKVSNGRLA